jgi:hypothetical protein
MAGRIFCPLDHALHWTGEHLVEGAGSGVLTAALVAERSPLQRGSPVSLGTTTTRQCSDARELLLCQAGHGNCGIQLNWRPLAGVDRGHQEEAVDVTSEVTLQAA